MARLYVFVWGVGCCGCHGVTALHGWIVGLSYCGSRAGFVWLAFYPVGVILSPRWGWNRNGVFLSAGVTLLPVPRAEQPTCSTACLLSAVPTGLCVPLKPRRGERMSGRLWNAMELLPRKKRMFRWVWRNYCVILHPIMSDIAEELYKIHQQSGAD